MGCGNYCPAQKTGQRHFILTAAFWSDGRRLHMSCRSGRNSSCPVLTYYLLLVSRQRPFDLGWKSGGTTTSNAIFSTKVPRDNRGRVPRLK